VLTEGLKLPVDGVHSRVGAALQPDVVLAACQEQLHDIDAATRKRWRVCRVVEALCHVGQYVRVAYALLPETGIPPERYWPKGHIVYFHWPARPRVRRRGTTITIDGQIFEVYRFPTDRRLRGLRRLTRRASLVQLWQGWHADTGTHESPPASAIRRELIRYVPEQKFVARLQVATPDAHPGTTTTTSVALRASSPQRCRDLLYRHAVAVELANTSSKYLYIPQAAIPAQAEGLILFEWMRGQSLLDKLRGGDVSKIMRRMARMLRSFHSLPFPGLEHLQPGHLRAQVRQAVADLCVTCPELSARLRALEPELDGRLAALPDVAPVTLHNDLHWNQVRIRQRRHALLDLERMCTGDPLLDVANFTAQVRMLGLRPEYDVAPTTADRWAREFLHQWATAKGQPVHAARLHLYSAVAVLKLAWSMMRHLRPGWHDLARKCVARAEEEASGIGREVSVP
jgi:aminoglycoside phosphotransferase (APT) family kinase protein